MIEQQAVDPKVLALEAERIEQENISDPDTFFYVSIYRFD